MGEKYVITIQWRSNKICKRIKEKINNNSAFLLKAKRTILHMTPAEVQMYQAPFSVLEGVKSTIVEPVNTLIIPPSGYSLLKYS